MKTNLHKMLIGRAYGLRLMLIALLSFILSQSASAQKADDREELKLILECIEKLGTDTYRAHFGYDNPENVTITADPEKSKLIYNGGEKKLLVNNVFEPGRHTYVFNRDFKYKDELLWKVILPNGQDLTVQASSESNVCVGLGAIIPYYNPPAGGKLNVSIIGPELTALYNKFLATGTASSDDIFQISTSGDQVLIKVIAISGQYQAMLDLLTTAGYNLNGIVSSDANGLTVSGYLPMMNLLKLNALPLLINYARPVYPAINNAGLTTTQGDRSIGSDFVRGGFNLQGEGVKVGVISNSYNTLGLAPNDVFAGDLPEGVVVLKESPVKSSDEGRAMMQIVHDIAPKAQLYFRTGSVSPDDFALGIAELQQAGCNIIVDDVTWLTEPFFTPGVVSRAVDAAANQGVAYFTSAGNFGDKSYESVFSPVPAPSGISGLAHNFGGNDVYQHVSLPPGSYTIVLQWEDFSPAQTDLDIFLSNTNGSQLLGFNRNNIGGDPVEVLPFIIQGQTIESNIVIAKATGNNVRFKYIVFRGQMKILEYVSGSSTIVGQANAAGAMSVGAVLFSNTPAYGVAIPTIASFSSTGGTRLTGETLAKQKPDFTAPNGVNTTVDMGGQNIDGDSFPNFFGTSAAAPHAAAAAALIVEARKKFQLETSVSPAAIRSLLQSTAIDMDLTGFDVNSGFGLIQVDAALSSFAEPAPSLSKLTVPAGVTPGSQPFTLTLEGNFFTPETNILFRGDFQWKYQLGLLPIPPFRE